MDKIIKVLGAVCSEVRQSRKNIIEKANMPSKDGYFILCYIIWRYYKSSAGELCQCLMTTRGMTYTAFCVAHLRMESDAAFLQKVRNVCCQLGIDEYYSDTPINQEDRERFNIQTEHTKQLFGAEHTHEDEAMMIRAMKRAEDYMVGYCKMGLKPIKPGYIRTRE